MSLNWPTSPTLGQVYTAPNGKQWKWNGSAWDALSSVASGPQGPQGPAGAGGGTGGLLPEALGYVNFSTLYGATSVYAPFKFDLSDFGSSVPSDSYYTYVSSPTIISNIALTVTGTNAIGPTASFDVDLIRLAGKTGSTSGGTAVSNWTWAPGSTVVPNQSFVIGVTSVNLPGDSRYSWKVTPNQSLNGRLRITGDTEVSGTQGPQGFQGPAGSGGGAGFSITDITYANFWSGLSASGITAGYYRITDFATSHYIIGATGDSYTGSTEPLIVFANGASSDHRAYSETYPTDLIYYDPNPNNWSADPSFSRSGLGLVTNFKGVIYYREDTKKRISTTYDWRNVKIRRWKIDSSGMSTWAPGVTYSKGQLVLDDNGVIYQCLATHNNGGATGATTNPLALDPNGYTYASTGIDNTIQRNILHHWLRFWDESLYLIPNLVGLTSAQGSTFSYEIGQDPETGSFPGATAGEDVYYVNLPIGASYQDFLTFATHSNPNLNDLILKSDIAIRKESSILDQAGESSIITGVRLESQTFVDNVETNVPFTTVYSGLTNSAFITGLKITPNVNTFITGQIPFILVYKDQWQYGDQFSGIIDTKIDGIRGFLSDSASLVEIGLSQGFHVERCNQMKVSDSDNILLRSTFRSRIDGGRGSNFLAGDGLQVFDSRENVYYFLRYTDLLGYNDRNRIMSGLIPGVTSSLSVSPAASQNNEIGWDFSTNYISDRVEETVIGEGFSNNLFHSIRFCDIGASFSGCTGNNSSTFLKVTVEPGSISNIDFQTSTIVYADYNSIIYQRPDGTPRLRYFNNSDTLVITGPTA